MAKSFSKKELAGKLVVDVALKRAETWLLDEFNRIRNNSKYPIISPMPHSNKSWAVGRYQLDQLENHMWRLHNGDRIDNIFYNKKAAILYAILTQQHQYKSADAIIKLDQTVSKQRDELIFFGNKVSKKTKSPFNLQLYEIRYTDSKAKYTSAREELEKTLNHAKYNKVWDTLL